MGPEYRFTRRDFVKGLGIALASLMLSRCAPKEGRTVGPPATPTGAGDAVRSQLRSCWQRFEWLAQHTRDSWDDDALGEDALNQLVAEHRGALDGLVASGALSAAAAEDVQDAFAAGVFHVWRSNVPITCYEPVLLDYKPATSAQLVQQADLLSEMAASGDLDPDTLARAQVAVERDVAFLSMSDQEVSELYEELMAAAGGSYSYPDFDQLPLEIPPECAEAARFLIELLSEGAE